MPDSVEIRPATIELKRAEWQTRPSLYAIISCTSNKDHMIVNTYRNRFDFVSTLTLFLVERKNRLKSETQQNVREFLNLGKFLRVLNWIRYKKEIYVFQFFKEASRPINRVI
jgi:hypothetical protein